MNNCGPSKSESKSEILVVEISGTLNVAARSTLFIPLGEHTWPEKCEEFL